VCMASRPGPRTIQLDEFQLSRGAGARIDPVAPPPQKRERQMLRNYLAVISDGICGIVPCTLGRLSRFEVARSRALWTMAIGRRI